MSYIAGLNGLRALAVTGVVWHHSHPGFAAAPLTAKGFLGVDVFFVVSGYLITRLLLEEQRLSESISLKNFYIRRTLRIFPLYYATLAMFSVYFLLTNPASSFFERLPYDLTYTSNWTSIGSIMDITWSLSTEEQFYLLWPPILVMLGRHSIIIVVMFLVLNQVINFRLIPALDYTSYAILQCTFTPIILGVLLAMYPVVISARITWIAILLALVFANTDDMQGAPRLAFHLAATIAVGGIAQNPTMKLVRALEWRPLAYVGVVSYGVYLLHKIGLDAAVRLLSKLDADEPMLVFLLGLGITLAMATASYRYFEGPILKLKSRLGTERVRRTRSNCPAAHATQDPQQST